MIRKIHRKMKWEYLRLVVTKAPPLAANSLRNIL